MLKSIALASFLALAACAVNDPNDVAGVLSREFATGEKLMNDCTIRQKKCDKWYEFKSNWEGELNNMVTFEAALANHKARQARGLAV
jgi:hypothetical protein